MNWRTREGLQSAHRCVACFGHGIDFASEVRVCKIEGAIESVPVSPCDGETGRCIDAVVESLLQTEVPGYMSVIGESLLV